MRDVRQWLSQYGLAQLAEVFEREQIDLDAARTLTDVDIKELGLPLGVRSKLRAAIQALQNTALATESLVKPEAECKAQSAERRQLTILFCDLVGSTALSQRLDPERLRELMQAYQQACRGVIEKYEGHVAQYLGDGLMVYFGWPQAHEDDAARAIRAGLEVSDAVPKLTIASTPITVRVGIHTGLVVVGETGQGDASIPRAAVGETPNIAARLQTLADPGSVVVSDRTQALAAGLFDYTDLGPHPLKGVAEPIRLFRVRAARAIESRFEATRGELALSPLVGREEEIALLLRRWQQAKEGEGQVVQVGGEPGVGKSRLAHGVSERLSQERYTVLRHQCSPYHVNSALHPAIEQFERAAGFTREDSIEQKLDKMEAQLAGDELQVAAFAPLFAALLSLPTERYPPVNLSPQKQKEKTLEALAGQVEALAQRQPVLIIYEDVQWIDATSQEALDLLVPRLRDLPVLMIVTYRPEYGARWTDQAHVSALGLNRLGRRQSAELVDKVAGGKTLPQEVLDQIVAHADGVPLFVEELTKSMLESRLLREERDRYVLDGPLPALAIPTTLRDSLIARLDRLAPVREVAQIGACIGREFTYELLAAVSPLKPVQLDVALEQLTASGLMFRRGTPPDATYTFKHALVQDTAYDSLLRSKRAQLHAQIAEVLEKNFLGQVEKSPELLAHHYTQAGNLTTAIPWWRNAGELSLRRVALQEAVGHFQKGLALVEQLPPSSERGGLEVSIREPLHAALVGLRGFAAPEITDNASAILEAAKSQGKPQSMLIGLWGMSISSLSQGRIAEALDCGQRLLSAGDKAGDIDLQVAGIRATVAAHFSLGQLLEAREQCNQILALYDTQRAGRWMQLAGHDARTLVGVYSSHSAWMLGYPDQAARVSEETEAHARRLGHAFNLGWTLTYGAYTFDFRREPQRLLERASEADRLAREQSVPYLYQVMVPEVEGLGRLRSGQLSESISLLRRAIENWNRLGGHLRIPYVKSALAEALALQGDLNVALRLIGECIEQIERPRWQERLHLAEVLRLKGWMLMRQGKGEEAELQLRASIDWACEQRAKSWELRSSTTLAELLATRGQRNAARDLLTPIYNWFTEGFDTKDLKDAKALLGKLDA